MRTRKQSIGGLTMGKNKKKYSAIAKVNSEMKGVERMEEKDFEQTGTEEQKEETTMEEKKHPVKDFISNHKTGLKMAGLGLLTFTVGCLCGAAGNRTSDGQKWGINRISSDTADCPDLIEIDDNDQTDETVAAETCDSTESTTIE